MKCLPSQRSYICALVKTAPDLLLNSNSQQEIKEGKCVSCSGQDHHIGHKLNLPQKVVYFHLRGTASGIKRINLKFYENEVIITFCTRAQIDEASILSTLMEICRSTSFFHFLCARTQIIYTHQCCSVWTKAQIHRASYQSSCCFWWCDDVVHFA